MAIPNPFLFSSLLLLLLLSLLPSGTAMSESELDSSLSALRSHGYTLFGNSITASDLRFDLLRPNASFTLFAPADIDLYNLGMSSTAFSYLRFLRRHVALGRHHTPALRRGADLHTLLPQRILRISRRSSDRLTANGVEVVAPGIFEAPNVVVHGLADHRRKADQIPVPLRSAPIATESAGFSRDEHLTAAGSPEMLRSQDHARLTPAAAPEELDLWVAAESLAPPAASQAGSCSAAVGCTAGGQRPLTAEDGF